jgi:FlaA1/EpsC-like NDP-sugar epimerase
LRNRYFLAIDGVGLVLSILIAYTLRFDGWSWLETDQRLIAFVYALVSVPLRLGLFYLLGVYRRFWSLAGVAEIELMVIASVVATAATSALAFALPATGLTPGRVPLSILLIDGLLQGFVIIIPRLSARLRERRRTRRQRRTRSKPTRPALIIGTGSSAQLLARELVATPNPRYRPVGFLDDHIGGRRGMLGDVAVLGQLSDLASAAYATGARDVIIALPDASGDTVRGIVREARAHGLMTTIAPSILNFDAPAARTLLRDVRIEDLLNRDPIVVDMRAVHEQLRDKVIMVTGAGGSIGSELCRQIASAHPRRLVLLGRGENSIFEIQQELRTTHPQLQVEPVIADVRDRERMAEVMHRTAPFAVFHAAAHKHVPLMEANVREALMNNVLGTLSVTDAARGADVQHVVLISSDKAVRPTSVMGATKRMAEQVVQRAALESGRPFVSVRFGNVLGSRGSVVPTFLRQIAAGGPVLVTHPEMRRYFMTIPEAVQLVLQAFSMGRGADVFCLDMGEPVSILRLAKDLITLTVDEAERTIDIRFTGIRPGEKLSEELFFNEEMAHPTTHPKILRAKLSEPTPQEWGRLGGVLQRLEGGATDDEMRQALAALFTDVPGAVSAADMLAEAPASAAAAAGAL